MDVCSLLGAILCDAYVASDVVLSLKSCCWLVGWLIETTANVSKYRKTKAAFTSCSGTTDRLADDSIFLSPLFLFFAEYKKLNNKLHNA